jgi:hypothetical protein
VYSSHFVAFSLAKTFNSSVNLPTPLGEYPMFLPSLVGELEAISFKIGQLILMTPHGGQVGFVSSKAGQKVAEDPYP